MIAYSRGIVLAGFAALSFYCTWFATGSVAAIARIGKSVCSGQSAALQVSREHPSAFSIGI
jgi:hypothetical protein